MTTDTQYFAAVQRTHAAPVDSASPLPCDDADAAQLRAVQSISASLDRLRVVCSEVGLATLLAEVSQVSPTLVCELLDEITDVGERVLTTLLHI